MKIAVVGCGAMGSIYAGRLALAGHEVLAIDRSAAHVEAMRTAGLQLDGPDGLHRIRLRAETVPPAEPMDLVILSVKAADAAGAAALARPLIGEGTLVVTIQNGLGSAEAVAGQVGADRLIVGIASGFGASRRGPGQVHHNAMRAIRFGSYAGLPTESVESVARAWRVGGFDAQAVPDIVAMQWEKLICNVAYSAPCGVTGWTVGQVMDDPSMGEVSRAAATEAWEVARALGVRLDVEDPVALVRAFGAQMPLAKPSVLLDLEAHRASEVDMINGAVVREARKIGMSAPVNATLTALVRAREATPPPLGS